MPKRRAASRWLSPSTWQAWRTLPYSSTENIPRLPARSDRARGRHQGGTVWHRRGRATQPAVSEGHFLTAAYTCPQANLLNLPHVTKTRRFPLRGAQRPAVRRGGVLSISGADSAPFRPPRQGTWTPGGLQG